VKPTAEQLRAAGDRCKKCQAEILWATTSNGKAIPVDAEIAAGGNIALEIDDVGMLRARVVRPAGDVEAYQSHFVLCPAAEYFRAGGEASADQAPDHDQQLAAKRRALQVRMPFGQYAGQTLEEIDRERRGHAYLLWSVSKHGVDWRRTDVRDAIKVVLGVES
jgi:hypothetical protein